MTEAEQRGSNAIESRRYNISFLAIGSRRTGFRVDDFQQRPIVNKMEAPALALAYDSFLTGDAEHRADLRRAIHIAERRSPELLHPLRPFDRIAPGRDEHSFEAAEVTSRQKVHLFTERGETSQIDGCNPDIMRLKVFHPLDLRLRVKDLHQHCVSPKSPQGFKKDEPTSHCGDRPGYQVHVPWLHSRPRESIEAVLSTAANILFAEGMNLLT